MIGIILFWLQYIAAVILLYTILKGSYVLKRGKRYDEGFIKTEERQKYPLWLILVFIIAVFIPVLNLGFYIAFISVTSHPIDGDGTYYKNFLTKEY